MWRSRAKILIEAFDLLTHVFGSIIRNLSHHILNNAQRPDQVVAFGRCIGSRASADALRQFKIIDILTMSASIADLPDGAHIALESNDLTDAELMGDEDFVIRIF